MGLLGAAREADLLLLTGFTFLFPGTLGFFLAVFRSFEDPCLNTMQLYVIKKLLQLQVWGFPEWRGFPGAFCIEIPNFHPFSGGFRYITALFWTDGLLGSSCCVLHLILSSQFLLQVLYNQIWCVLSNEWIGIGVFQTKNQGKNDTFYAFYTPFRQKWCGGLHRRPLKVTSWASIMLTRLGDWNLAIWPQRAHNGPSCEPNCFQERVPLQHTTERCFQRKKVLKGAERSWKVAAWKVAFSWKHLKDVLKGVRKLSPFRCFQLKGVTWKVLSAERSDLKGPFSSFQQWAWVAIGDVFNVHRQCGVMQ